jgi:LysR family carnitine catabolism transcriptional activator
VLDISTRVLRAFIALDDLRSFSLAAERCNVTQSALSQMISKLERDVNLRLVDRDRRHVVLTSDGERFVATARRVMAEFEAVSVDLRDRANLRTGRLVLTAQPSLAAHWLPPIIAAFQARYPGIQIGLFDSVPEKALEQIRQRQADLGLTARGPGISGLQHRLLFHDRFVVVTPRSHPLATRKSLALKDLAGHRFIRLIRTGSIAQHLELALRGVELVDSGLEVEQVATLAGLLANELGISVVPVAALPYFDRSRVAAIPLTDARLGRPIYLVWPVAAQLSLAAQSFVEMLDKPPSFDEYA